MLRKRHFRLSQLRMPPPLHESHMATTMALVTQSIPQTSLVRLVDGQISRCLLSCRDAPSVVPDDSLAVGRIVPIARTRQG